VGCWRGYLSGARCRLAHGPADVTATRVVLDKGPLNVCVCVFVEDWPEERHVQTVV